MAKHRGTNKINSEKQYVWYFATNVENLKNIIAQGLISSPKGFIKYYSDALEITSGYLPLFKDSIPKMVFDAANSETRELNLCIIGFSLIDVNGVVHGITNTAEDDHGLFDEKKDTPPSAIKFSLKELQSEEKNVEALFIQTPVPTSLIKSVIFSNKEDKIQFEKDSKIFSNIPIEELVLKVEPGMFEYSKIGSLTNIKLTRNEPPLNKKVQAYGGMILLAFYFSKNGIFSNQMYHIISQSDDILKIQDENIKAIYSYFIKEKEDNSILSQLYWGLIEILIDATDIKNKIVSFLENYDDTKLKKRRMEIAQTLRDFESLNAKSISNLLREAKSTFEKVLLMLFIREDGSDLIDYHSDELSETDYFVTALLFGIRDKFVNSPKFIREFFNLQNHVTSLMANYWHKLEQSEMKFPLADFEPPTIIDLFENRKILDQFIKKKSINCLESVIKVPFGEHKIKILPSGLELHFEGEPKNIQTTIAENKLYDFLKHYKLDDYNEFLKHIKR